MMKYNFLYFYISMIYLKVIISCFWIHSIYLISEKHSSLDTSHQLWMQQILNISQNELFYPLAVQFAICKFVSILHNIYLYQLILNKFFITSIVLYSVHSSALHRHNLTYITHTKLLHLDNLNWMRKLNSNQLNHIFNVTPRQPEIKSKFSKSLTQPSRITCSSILFNSSSILFNMCYTTPAQPKIFTNKIIQRYTHFLSSQKMISNVYTCTTWILCEDIIVHYTRTTWLYDISTIWFQDSTPAQPKIFVDDMILHYARTTWLSLHSYNLITGFYTCTT